PQVGWCAPHQGPRRREKEKGGKYSLAYLLLACVESQFIVLVKSLCKNFELELKEAFKFCEGLKVPQKQYEGKIIYPNMAKEFIAYLDMQGFFTNQKCFILSDNIKDKNRLLYLTAILNSKTNFWYFKQIGATLGASGYEMSKIFVEKLPVVETHKIDSTLLKEIENLASEILESKEADSNSSVADLESRLDSLVYKAYGLNENEINLIESELSTREREREREQK
ncbi:TaqI-like C-terminal specificity domain-containing protein, partial [Helicobacter typhlonius]|uniref:TaqI-like C-terminal specificity domain-containing protein n=1 Tax=Helicobacter typhlonius TaxID=76936 RepID=UPI002FDF5BB1